MGHNAISSVIRLSTSVRKLLDATTASAATRAPLSGNQSRVRRRSDVHQGPSLFMSEPVDVDTNRVELPIAAEGNSTRDIQRGTS